MAVIGLDQKGTALVAQSSRLVVTLNRPRVKGVYDQCGILTHVRTSGSYSINGRATCNDRMVEILRCSYKYMQAAPDIADAAGDIVLDNVRATANTFVEVPFGGENADPNTPVETSKVQAFYVLEDQCGEPIGNVEETNFNRFVFTEDCRQVILTSLTTKIAVNEALGSNVQQMHTVLGGFFRDAAKTGGSQEATTAAWLDLANTDITLNIPGLENVRVNSTAPNQGG